MPLDSTDDTRAHARWTPCDRNAQRFSLHWKTVDRATKGEHVLVDVIGNLEDHGVIVDRRAVERGEGVAFLLGVPRPGLTRVGTSRCHSDSANPARTLRRPVPREGERLEGLRRQGLDRAFLLAVRSGIAPSHEVKLSDHRCPPGLRRVGLGITRDAEKLVLGREGEGSLRTSFSTMQQGVGQSLVIGAAINRA